MMLNPEDRNAIEDLFAKLETVERQSGPRDADAEDLIRQRISDQPAAPYYLAQTVVVQERALQEAERRMADLEAQLARGRDTGLERRGPWGGSVQERQDGGYERRGGGGFGGGGFLAGAAQTAMGVAGGVLLGNMIAGMFDGGQAHASEGAQDDGNEQDDQGQDDVGGNDGDFGGSDFDSGGDF